MAVGAAIWLARQPSSPAKAPRDAVQARLAAAKRLVDANRAAAAENALKECLQDDPHQLEVHERLAWLLSVEGRRFESLPHLYELLRRDRATVSWLMAAGNHDVAFGEESRLAAFHAAEPENALVSLGLARIELKNKRNRAEARQLLEKVLVALPEQVEAHALLGRIFWDERDHDALARWAQRLPAATDAHPDIWLVRGLLANESGDVQGAARSFWEALRRDANHQAATFQLCQALHLLEAEESRLSHRERAPFRGAKGDLDFLAERARRLEELAETLFDLHLRPHELRLVQRAITLTEGLGRLWEARGWYAVARSMSPDNESIMRGLLRMDARLSLSDGPTLAECDPGRRLDLSQYPLPRLPPRLGHEADPPRGIATVATFRETAKQAGIDFTYFRGCPPHQADGRMFQFTGGGAAVLDFDLDGWPDLYFTQGCRWPPQAGQSEFLDHLYRNVGGGQFAHVTSQARLFEDRFSQGAAVGDFDADGFPDLYIANIGRNRLLMNCGDGTFLDVTADAGLSDTSWTTSCLLADLSGDGLPDIYDVNYVTGEDVFERVCEQRGKVQTCTPHSFVAEPDCFWLNLGNGGFRDCTEVSGFSVRGGNGLGVVAANFNGRGRLSLFVANDQDANFYFVNQGSAEDGVPRFAEMGVLSGLAFDGQGKAQASMGVAAGDANDDGLLDLFVTDFYQLSSALYVQRASDLFEEVAAPAGLQAPSFEMLGFGAQFVDGELDGLPDLVVTNGHLDDLRELGIPYQMRPQYFHNLGKERFAESTGEQLGEFFSQLHVGRGLARLDFNRDGREDFVISQLDEPAALLCNETKNAGHFLALVLHGTRSARDAIGTRVSVSAGGKTWTRELTAGDGYMASNQRQLVFGLGANDSLDEIRFAWPSGIEQIFHRVPADCELIVVEGRDELVRLPR